MKEILFIIVVLVVCMVPLSLIAEIEAINKGSFEFGLGTTSDLTLYEGNVEATELTLVVDLQISTLVISWSIGFQ
jgi:hypothetical protein